MLRSKTPDGAEQEVWALLCAHHAIREVIYAAAMTRQDPLRISFAAALDAVRAPVGSPGSFSSRRADRLFRASLQVIASVTSRPRPGRDNPRHAKRSHRRPAKAADPAKRGKPSGLLVH